MDIATGDQCALYDLDGAARLRSPVVNQQAGADGDYVEGGEPFQILASVTLPAARWWWSLSNAANGYVLPMPCASSLVAPAGLTPRPRRRPCQPG